MIGEALNAEFIPALSTEMFPRDEISELLDRSAMSEIDEFLARVGQMQQEKNLSDRALSMAATGKPDLIRSIRNRRAFPKGDNLTALAKALDTSIDYLIHGTSHQGNARLSETPLDFRPQPSLNDLPVVGTAQGGTVIIKSMSGNDTEIEQTLFEPGHVIRYIARPKALLGAREAYAIYVEGESMYPRFGPGEMAVVDPRIPPKIGDDVIIQLSENGGDEITAILIKRLVRRSASFIELEQFNPAAIFRVDADRIKRLHRICPAGDLLGG